MLGSGISPVEPPKVYGIDYNGRLEDLLQFDELLKAKREDPIASRDVQRIIDHLQADPNYEVVMYSQAIHDKREIVDVVKRFF